MFETKKTLIVVYKDELLVNQLRKMVEAHDDTKEGVVGTTDDSINIVAWPEKVWLVNKKAGNDLQGKVLFLDEIKDTDKLIPVIDAKFDEYGVKFGWAGNQAVLYVTPKALADRKAYNAFLEKLSAFSPPEILKVSKDNAAAMELGPVIKKLLFSGALPLVKAVKAAFKNKALMKRQMLFYGVVKLYYDGLEEFMNQ